MAEQQPLAFLLHGEYRDKYPHKLVAQFPHVARHLESIWRDPAAVADYLSELMISKRPNRKGFPLDVAAEIMSLSITYDLIGHLVAPAEAHPAPAVGGNAQAWDLEPETAEIDGHRFPFTREGFARAVEAGREDVCRRFLKAGFDIDSRDVRHWTPLMISAFHGREQLAIQLIRFGADIRAIDRGGYSAMHWAAFSGFGQVVALLLDKGLPPDPVSRAGITPLLQASARGHLQVVDLLLAHQANPNLAAADGATPLFKAVANNHYSVVLLLIKAGAKSDVTLNDGTMLKDLSAKAKDARIRALLA